MRQDYYKCRFADWGDLPALERLDLSGRAGLSADEVTDLFYNTVGRKPRLVVCTYEGAEVVGFLHFSYAKTRPNSLPPCDWSVTINALHVEAGHDYAQELLMGVFDKPWIASLMPRGPGNQMTQKVPSPAP